METVVSTRTRLSYTRFLKITDFQNVIRFIDTSEELAASTFRVEYLFYLTIEMNFHRNLCKVLPD
jgi:hypothetical protein